MQRSTGEIVEWNLKKILSKTCDMQHKLSEIIQRARDGQFDDLHDANLIANNMAITMELLEYDQDRFLEFLSDKAPGKEQKSAETAKMLTFPTMDKPCKDLTSKKHPQQSKCAGNNEVKDSLTFNSVIKQIKTLEGIVLSGNLIERINKLERDQSSSSQNILSRLEGFEKSFLHENLLYRVEVLEKKAGDEIQSRLEELEAHDQQIVKGVFGDFSGLGSCVPNVVSQLSTMENLLNEENSRINAVEENLKKIESREAQKAVPDPQEKDVAVGCWAVGEGKNEDEDWSEDEDSDSSFGESSSDGIVEFSVRLSHYGPWEGGIVIRDLDYYNCNEGDAFDLDRCMFVPPKDGQYRIYLMTARKETGNTRVEVWSCGKKGGWIEPLLYTQLQSDDSFRKFKKIVTLQAGQLLRLRVFGGTPFEYCDFEGKLLNQ